jgi:cystathionine gamma-synthase
MANQVGLHPDTLAVIAGRPQRVPDAPLNEPLTLASTYVAGGEREYGRYGNPTWGAFEAALGALEGGHCLAYSSGMAAASALLDLVPTGAIVVSARHGYLGVSAALSELHQQGRVCSQPIDVTNQTELYEAIRGAAWVWLESPTNPALELVELSTAIAVAREVGAKVVVDNTFCTPLLQQPLKLGADLVLHSATKLIAGHSDLLLGAVVAADANVAEGLKKRRDQIGNTPGSLEAWLALRGLRSLPVRLERAQATASELAMRLAGHPKISEVRYPGFGTIISIVLPDAPGADQLTSETVLWINATSLGGAESTLERRRRWVGEQATIPEGLVRLSVGLENVEDLWRDLVGALNRL